VKTRANNFTVTKPMKRTEQVAEHIADDLQGLSLRRSWGS